MNKVYKASKKAIPITFSVDLKVQNPNSVERCKALKGSSGKNGIRVQNQDLEKVEIIQSIFILPLAFPSA